MRTNTVRMVVTMTPKEGHIDELQAIIAEGLQYHKDLPGCLKWALVRQIAPDDGTEVLQCIEEWENPKAIYDHAETEWAKKTMADSQHVMEKMEYKMSKVICGFDEK